MRTREVPIKLSVVRPKSLLNCPNPLASKLFLRDSVLGFKRSEDKAGESVSALKAEIRTEIAMVTANC